MRDNNNRWLLYSGLGALVLVFALVIFYPTKGKQIENEMKKDMELQDYQANTNNTKTDYDTNEYYDTSTSNEYANGEYKYYRVDVNDENEFYTSNFDSIITDDYEMIGFTPYQGMYMNEDPYYFTTSDYNNEMTNYQETYMSDTKGSEYHTTTRNDQIYNDGFRTSSFIIKSKKDITDFGSEYPYFKVSRFHDMSSLKGSYGFYE